MLNQNLSRVTTNSVARARQVLADALLELSDVLKANFVDGFMEVEQHKAQQLLAKMHDELLRTRRLSSMHVCLFEKTLIELRDIGLRDVGRRVLWADAIRNSVRRFATARRHYHFMLALQAQTKTAVDGAVYKSMFPDGLRKRYKL